jgi:N-acetylglucosaminyldiphosphoundecaprenol N-acetyl-beta-D-mannosaminyltransferase
MNCPAELAARNTEELSFDVYCILGMPIDAIDMPGALERIRAAAAASPYSIVRNILYVIVVWLARLLGIALKDRLAGSDIFDALSVPRGTGPLKVVLFGGHEGVAAAACKSLNAARGGLILTVSERFFPASVASRT